MWTQSRYVADKMSVWVGIAAKIWHLSQQCVCVCLMLPHTMPLQSNTSNAASYFAEGPGACCWHAQLSMLTQSSLLDTEPAVQENINTIIF